MGEIRNAYSILIESLNGRNHSDGLEVNGMIILKWNSRK
jgi:hypothetical protein